MSSDSSFPQKLALGKYFCNRTKEQQYLKNQINSVRPTLITAPRRYGKTSLGVQVLDNLKIPYVHLDLFPLVSIEDIENVMLSSIGEIIGMIESTPQKSLKAITQFFGALNLSFSIANAKIEVSFAKGKTQPSTLLNALKNINTVLQKKKKRAVLFLDEFQRLAQLPESEKIEGAIRYVAQQSNNLIFIFSGSNRHLLEKMFSDSHRPLYKLCDHLILERIDSAEYAPFIQKFAQVTWKKKLDSLSLDTIFEYTDCHPYYINVLCYRLWQEKKCFDQTQVVHVWHDYAIGEKSTVFREVEGLSDNQLKLLISLARFGKTESILNDTFLNFSQMAQSSAKQSAAALEQRDFIYRDRDHKYCVLDPLIKYVLSGR